MTGGLANPETVQAVADTRLQTVARGIQTQVDQRIQRVEQSTAGLRRVTIASRDPATLTCTVHLDGDTSTPVPCALGTPAAVPVVGAMGWALQNGTDLLLVGTDAGLPKVRMRSTATSGSVTSEETWVFSAGTVEYDTDWDGTAGMFDSASGGITFPWPGKYAFGMRSFVTSTAGFIPIARIRINGVTYIDAWQDTCVNSNAMHFSMHNERAFAADDVITIRISSSGGASVFGTNSNEIGTAMWASYIP